MSHPSAKPYHRLDDMNAIARQLRAVFLAEPVATTYAGLGTSLAGGMGAIAGMIIGLNAYPPTAWFAAFELGVPAAIAGGLFGLLSCGIVKVLRRWKHREAR